MSLGCVKIAENISLNLLDIVMVFKDVLFRQYDFTIFTVIGSIREIDIAN